MIQNGLEYELKFLMKFPLGSYYVVLKVMRIESYLRN